MSNVRLRAAQPNDLSLLQALSAEARSPYRQIPGLEHIADSPPVAPERFSAGQAIVATGETTDTVLGFALIRTLDGGLYVDNISVVPRAQGRGVGSVLLECAAKIAAASALPSIFLTTFRDPPWNAPWFKRHGFKVMPADLYGEGLRTILAEQGRYLDLSLRDVLWRGTE